MNIRSLFPQSIAGRLTFWFLLITLIPSILLVTTMFLMIRSAVEQAASEQLEYVMKDRVEEVKSWTYERSREAELISRTVRCSSRAFATSISPANKAEQRDAAAEAEAIDQIDTLSDASSEVL